MPVTDADRRALWWTAIGGVILAALYWLGPVLAPFLLAAVLAYVCQPLVLWLGGKRLPRTLAVLAVMLVEALALVILALTVLPLFAQEITQLSVRLPMFLDRMNEIVAPWLASKFGITVGLDAASVKDAIHHSIANSEGLGMKILSSLHLGGLGLLGLFANLVLTPVVQFFLMRDWELIASRIDVLIPRAWHERVIGFVHESDQALGQYLHGQILVILIMCAFYTTGLWLAGLEFALPIGMITGTLVFVPYVGAATGLVLGSLAALLQFQDWTGLAFVWAVFALGQVLEGNFITPRLVGRRIGLHPVAVIFALLAFGQVLGLVGLLIALPASAVLLVALRKLKARYQQSTLYKGGP
jgi:predicted PurR-regulated permease PerM